MSIAVQSVNCNNCGAPLSVGASTNYATCGHCGSQLAVHRTGNALFTERIDQLEAKTTAIAETVAELALKDRLEEIDRAWERERLTHLVPTWSQTSRLPSAVLGRAFLTAGFLGLGLAIALMWYELNACVVVGLTLTGAVLFTGGWRERERTRDYQTAYGLYLIRRMNAKKPNFASPAPPTNP